MSELTLTEVKITNSGYLKININCLGTVPTVADLPTTDLSVNDTYLVSEDGLYYTFDGDEWCSCGGTGVFPSGGGGGSVIVDSELSESSENPVQNKVVTTELKNAFNQVSKIQTGRYEFTITTTETKHTITFPEAFTESPQVIFSVFRYGYTDCTDVVLNNIGKSGFSFTAITNNVSGGTGCYISWVAIGGTVGASGVLNSYTKEETNNKINEVLDETIGTLKAFNLPLGSGESITLKCNNASATFLVSAFSNNNNVRYTGIINFGTYNGAYVSDIVTSPHISVEVTDSFNVTITNNTTGTRSNLQAIRIAGSGELESV